MEMRYPRGHETPRNFRAPGKAKAPSHRPVEAWSFLSSDRCGVEGVAELRCSLGASLSDRRVRSAASPARPRTSRAVDSRSKGETAPASREGPPGRRVLHESVDSHADRQADPHPLWHPLPSRALLASDASPTGLDVPEARAEGHATERGRDRALEAAGVAAYKKTPISGEPISSLSTKVGSCSSPTLSGRGHPRGRPLSSIISTGRTRCLRSPHSAFPQSDGGPPSTSAFGPGTSPGPWWRPFCGSSSATSGGLCWCCGTGARSTATMKSNASGSAPPERIGSSSPRTLLSSTRPSLSGLKAIRRWPTAPQKPSQFCTSGSTRPRTESANPRNSCGPVSSPANCLGHVRQWRIHYLRDAQ